MKADERRQNQDNRTLYLRLSVFIFGKSLSILCLSKLSWAKRPCNHECPINDPQCFHTFA